VSIAEYLAHDHREDWLRDTGAMKTFEITNVPGARKTGRKRYGT